MDTILDPALPSPSDGDEGAITEQRNRLTQWRRHRARPCTAIATVRGPLPLTSYQLHCRYRRTPKWTSNGRIWTPCCAVGRSAGRISNVSKPQVSLQRDPILRDHGPLRIYISMVETPSSFSCLDQFCFEKLLFDAKWASMRFLFSFSIPGLRAKQLVHNLTHRSTIGAECFASCAETPAYEAYQMRARVQRFLQTNFSQRTSNRPYK